MARQQAGSRAILFCNSSEASGGPRRFGQVKIELAGQAGQNVNQFKHGLAAQFQMSSLQGSSRVLEQETGVGRRAANPDVKLMVALLQRL